MGNTTVTTNDSVQAVLAQGAKRGKTGKGKWLLTLTIAAALAGGAGYFFLANPQSGTQTVFKTTEVKTGKLAVTVTATGNLQPKNEVDIGTELSGTVVDVLVEENAVVKKGQALAHLNTTQLNDTITKDKAALASAEAKVRQANATVKEAQTNLARLRELNRTSGGQLPAKSELDTAAATLERAQADVAVAKTSVTSAQAELRSAETNLGKATITSPINGVVLTRSVEPGQTVAASLSAPTLFTLAEDLAQMEVEVGVDEADVGNVKAGQKATFTVDAWAGREYQAEITRVSLGSTTTDHVVTYTTVLDVQNTDLTLRPGMTATATISTDNRDNALLIPNAALHFSPPSGNAADESGQARNGNSSFLAKLMPRPPMSEQKKRPTSTNETAKPAANGLQKVWVLENNAPVAVEIKTGISDGKVTEVISGDLKAGMQVITDSSTGKKP